MYNIWHQMLKIAIASGTQTKLQSLRHSPSERSRNGLGTVHSRTIRPRTIRPFILEKILYKKT